MNKATLEFLYDLKENNKRDWFQANKNRYEDARRDMEQFIDFLIPAIHVFDPLINNLTARQCMFRIYRDIRFTKDKTPYKSYFGAYIAPGGRKSAMCGYYVHLEPGNCLLAGGAYHPAPEHLKNIRVEIYENLKEFEQLLHQENFKNTFGELVGDRLKRPPKGFGADSKGIDYLKMKDFTFFHRLSEEQVLAPDFAFYVVNVFNYMKPLNDFLNRALM